MQLRIAYFIVLVHGSVSVQHSASRVMYDTASEQMPSCRSRQKSAVFSCCIGGRCGLFYVESHDGWFEVPK